jgi:hypothetical protein
MVRLDWQRAVFRGVNTGARAHVGIHVMDLERAVLRGMNVGTTILHVRILKEQSSKLLGNPGWCVNLISDLLVRIRGVGASGTSMVRRNIREVPIP